MEKLKKSHFFQILVNNIKYEHSLLKITNRVVQGFLNVNPKPEHRAPNSSGTICFLI